MSSPLSPQPEPAPEPVNVLLVDDRPDKLLALQSILSDIGENVVLARSGEEALRHLLRADFAVILLDVQMPMMDGFETAALIRARKRSERTPIIFLTAIDETEAYVARGYSLGAVDYIRMPFPPEMLKAKVAVFVELFRKTEQIRQQAEWVRAAREREFVARLAEAADRLDFETRRNRFFILAVDMLGIAGFDGQLRQLNPSWERTLGYDEQELRGQRFTHLLHPHDCEAAEAQFKALVEGLPIGRFEARHLHRDGTYRWLSWTAVPFAEEGVVYVFARDVTETKQAEEARLHLVAEQEARRAAQRENELKDQFLATLSHELRAPLTPILGWITMLRSGRLSREDANRGLEVIHRNVKLQSQLMEDLLDVSRIVSGKLRLELKPIELGTVIEAGLDNVRPAVSAKRITLNLRGLDVPAEVRGDAGRLQQVIWNLVSNAVKFTPEGGTIEVAVAVEGNQACVSVTDSGIGISPEFLPHIFDRFRQAETGSSRSHGGLGLGLTIVRHLVEAHGGAVRGESGGIGLGARFVVALPLVEAVPATPGAGLDETVIDGESMVLEGLKLLVVDDDQEVCELLRLSLNQQGAQVRSACSASEALACVDAQLADVIVSDIGMPGTDGYGLIASLRARAPECGSRIPAIALTAYASEDEVARARAAGFQLHLAKPVTPERVIEAIRSLAAQTHVKVC
jgi:PAS domain S-box-containing protein